MIAFFIAAIKIIFLLGFLVFIHELGHFTVAKLSKVQVNEFAIGFGPTIWQKQGKETKYAIRALPFGGFVSMEGETEQSENEKSFSKASIPKRIAIVAAGAIINIIFAVVVYFILMTSEGVYISNEIDTTIDGYAAQDIGLQQGDKIIEIGNKKVSNKYDISEIMNNSKGEELNIKIERKGKKIDYKITPTEVETRVTGIYLSEDGKVSAVEKGSSSEKSGIKSNDKIIKINGEEVNGDTNKIIELVNKENIEKILFTVQRENEQIDIEVIPEIVPTYYLGINFKVAEDTLINRIIYAGIETKNFAFSIIDNLKMLVTGNIGVDQMMGPVGISEVVAKTDGVREFIYMLALISLSLGITNLLPIPALDGGKIVILIIEAIRRKPLTEKTEINMQLIGFSLIIALSLYVTYRDVIRIF